MNRSFRELRLDFYFQAFLVSVVDSNWRNPRFIETDAEAPEAVIPNWNLDRVSIKIQL